jgi:hypothetical protein
MHIQALPQQFSQRCRRFVLTLGRDVLHQCLDCALDRDAQQGVWVHADRRGHADRLGNNVERVGPLGGGALDPADQSMDGGTGSVWHSVSMTDGAGTNQEPACTGPCANIVMKRAGRACCAPAGVRAALLGVRVYVLLHDLP